MLKLILPDAVRKIECRIERMTVYQIIACFLFEEVVRRIEDFHSVQPLLDTIDVVLNSGDLPVLLLKHFLLPSLKLIEDFSKLRAVQF